MSNIWICEATTYFAWVLTSNDSVLKLTDSVFGIYFCNDRREVGQSVWTAVWNLHSEFKSELDLNQYIEILRTTTWLP